MKKQLLLFILTLLPMLAMADDSGSCGENVTYTYNSTTKTLTIQGSGAMTNYNSSSDIPWYSYKNYIQTVIIEEGVTSIGWYAFSDCSSLTSVTIPNTVTRIGVSAFAGCSGLISFIIPNNVTSIGSSAFSGCSGLTSVTIPNGVTSITNSMFSGCSSLISITIGSGVTYIGSDAFYNCSGLQKVIVPDIAAWCAISFANNSDNPLYYAHHIYSDDNTEIKELVITNKFTCIERYAFYGCFGLTSVTIGNSMTSIEKYAFDGCFGLTSVEFHCAQIGSWFKGMTSIKEVVIGNEVTSIGARAFEGCSGVEKVVISDIAKWCSFVFGGYSDNPLYYAHHIYSDKNTEITEIVIPEGVNIIGQYAFYNCENITSVAIPSSVTSIGKNAFSCGIKLSTVNVNMNIPIEIDESVFEFTGENYSKDIIYLAATLNVPKGSKNLYSNVKGWKKFANIQEVDFSGVETIKQKSTPTSYYSVSGEKLNNVHRGVNIIRMSDGTTRKVVVK